MGAPRSKGHVTEATFYEASGQFNTASGNGKLKIQDRYGDSRFPRNFNILDQPVNTAPHTTK